MASAVPSCDVINRDPPNISKVTGPYKRKTPSELRQEQMKRVQTRLSQTSVGDAILSVTNKDGQTSQRKYIDTRVLDIYPVTKCYDQSKSIPSKDKPKTNEAQEHSSSLSRLSVLSSKNMKNETSASRVDIPLNVSKQRLKCRESDQFCNVANLSSSSSVSNPGAINDMKKALKALGNSKSSNNLILPVKFPGHLKSSIPPQRLGNNTHVTQQKTLLDLTLKLSMRITSPCSLSWCHGISNLSKHSAMKEALLLSHSVNHHHSKIEHVHTQLLKDPGVSFWQSLHSWVYPQSVLPSSLVSTLALSAAQGSSADDEFLSQRIFDWQESFRSLYYLFRKGHCGIFYVCMHQFIVMFIHAKDTGNVHDSCSAYISRSTRGLRTLLKENDVGFVMPLFNVEVDPTTTEELRELSEFEKMNPGQTQVVDFTSNIDNTAQSLLAFIGNKNVHGIYDFLLNHRSLLSSVASVDVPQLYSPVPFENASLDLPKINLKVMKKAESFVKPSIANHGQTNGSIDDSTSTTGTDNVYSLDLRTAFLTPWVVSRLCAVLCGVHKDFEASFVTEPLSHGLNVVMSSIKEDALKESSLGLGICDSFAHPVLKSSFVKQLTHLDGMYVSQLSYA